MAITVARLNFLNVKNDDEFRELALKIREDLEGVALYDSGCREFTTRWAFGNDCLPGVPLDKAVELAEKYGLTLDEEKTVLEPSDIDALEVGQKVTLVKNNTVVGLSQKRGTVYAKDDEAVVIRKYRSKTKGWVLRVGEVGAISVGW